MPTVTFKGNNPAYSYCKLDKNSNDIRQVYELEMVL